MTRYRRYTEGVGLPILSDSGFDEIVERASVDYLLARIDDHQYVDFRKSRDPIRSEFTPDHELERAVRALDPVGDAVHSKRRRGDMDLVEETLLLQRDKIVRPAADSVAGNHKSSLRSRSSS
jgi:hypothetical protein